MPRNAVILLTEDQLIDRYDPEEWPNGDLYRQREWCDAEDAKALEIARAERRIWTVLESDNNEDMIVVNGDHYINRLYSIITRKPWKEGEEIECRWQHFNSET